MGSEAYLAAVRQEFQRYKRLGERALAQVRDDDWFVELDPESNSLAVIVKHLAGNLRSRWMDFLTSDGEKPDRQRDREFILEPGDTQQSLEQRWQAGWRCVLDTLDALTETDLPRSVTIRGEPHPVPLAIERSLAHTAYHVGQIVFLARHLAGANWRALSIPRGQSEQFAVAVRKGTKTQK